jgi:hypothetical protein
MRLKLARLSWPQTHKFRRIVSGAMRSEVHLELSAEDWIVHV